MNMLIILAHPDPHSFNHAMAAAAQEELRSAGHTVVLHDLYQEQFDPVLPAEEIPLAATLPPAIAAHCNELQQADGILIIHPNWWGQPPAILKGWVDRVIRPGVAYRFLENDSGEGVPLGLLKARTALIFNTSNTEEKREQNAFGDPLENIWRRCIFDLCGVRNVQRRMFETIVTSTPEQRRIWLNEVRGICRECFPA